MWYTRKELPIPSADSAVINTANQFTNQPMHFPKWGFDFHHRARGKKKILSLIYEVHSELPLIWPFYLMRSGWIWLETVEACSCWAFPYRCAVVHQLVHVVPICHHHLVTHHPSVCGVVLLSEEEGRGWPTSTRWVDWKLIIIVLWIFFMWHHNNVLPPSQFIVNSLHKVGVSLVPGGDQQWTPQKHSVGLLLLLVADVHNIMGQAWVTHCAESHTVLRRMYRRIQQTPWLAPLKSRATGDTESNIMVTDGSFSLINKVSCTLVWSCSLASPQVNFSLFSFPAPLSRSHLASSISKWSLNQLCTTFHWLTCKCARMYNHTYICTLLRHGMHRPAPSNVGLAQACPNYIPAHS